MSHHRHTHVSCRKALQTCPRQLTSPKLSSACLMAWHILPTTTGARCQPSCTSLPAAPPPLAETSTPSQELLLWGEHLALIAGTWTHSSKANYNCQEKNCPFFSSLTLSGLSPGTRCCLLPGRWGELNPLGQTSITWHLSLHIGICRLSVVPLGVFLAEQNEPLSRRCLSQTIFQTCSNFRILLLPA